MKIVDAEVSIMCRNHAVRLFGEDVTVGELVQLGQDTLRAKRFRARDIKEIYAATDFKGQNMTAASKIHAEIQRSRALGHTPRAVLMTQSQLELLAIEVGVPVTNVNGSGRNMIYGLPVMVVGYNPGGPVVLSSLKVEA